MSRLIAGLGRRWRRLNTALGYRASQSAWLSSIFYSVANTSFRREQQAVLAGQRRFGREKRAPADSSSVLRRNTHRLEKGIISRPRRDIFALDYIEETICVYEFAVANDACVGAPEVHWAHDVLSQYFEFTGPHPKLDELRRRFELTPNPSGGSKADRFEARVPYTRNLDECPVEYEALLQLARRRRSVRWFEQKKVPRDLLLKALAIATQSPSACNRQPFEFRVFDDPELLSKVAKLPAGTTGYEHNFPCVVVVIGRQRYYFDERDRHLIYIDSSLATMAFVLALETLGLSSCCINWPDIEDREQLAAKILHLEPDERPVMFIAVGFPDPTGLVPYSEKRTPQQICRFNFE